MPQPLRGSLRGVAQRADLTESQHAAADLCCSRSRLTGVQPRTSPRAKLGYMRLVFIGVARRDRRPIMPRSSAAPARRAAPAGLTLAGEPRKIVLAPAPGVTRGRSTD